MTLCWVFPNHAGFYLCPIQAYRSSCTALSWNRILRLLGTAAPFPGLGRSSSPPFPCTAKPPSCGRITTPLRRRYPPHNFSKSEDRKIFFPFLRSPAAFLFMIIHGGLFILAWRPADGDLRDFKRRLLALSEDAQGRRHALRRSVTRLTLFILVHHSLPFFLSSLERKEKKVPRPAKV